MAAIATVTLASPAAADPEPETQPTSARDAYERGKAAFAEGDAKTAARLLALADALSPNDVALAGALRSAIRADAAGLAMELSDRATARRTDNPEIAGLVTEARDKLAAQAGKLRVTCDGCDAEIDNHPAATGTDHWVTAGRHLVTIRIGERREPRLVSVPGGETVHVRPRDETSPPPPRPPPSPAPEEAQGPDVRGLSPGWFWTSTGVTVVLAAATVILATDTESKHNAFLREPTAQTSGSGRTAQTLTHVFGVATGVSALATIIVGAAAVNWRPSTVKTSLTAAITPLPGGAVAVVGASF